MDFAVISGEPGTKRFEIQNVSRFCKILFSIKNNSQKISV